MDIRKKLVDQRKKQKICASRVARFIKITPVALSRFENGKTMLKIEHLTKYAEYLGLELKLILKD